MAEKQSPPKAQKTKHIHEKFGDQREDFYYWLRNKDSKEVLSYLNEENKYSEKILSPLDSLRKKLFQEMKSRIPGEYDTEPVSYGNYLYYSSWSEGKNYSIHKRICKKTKKEEVILDENLLAEKSEYCDVGAVEVSYRHDILAYSLDSKGRELYDIYFKDLNTGKNLKNFISQVTSDFIWANDNQTLFYVQQDPVTLRAYQVYRFNIVTNKKTLVYEEKDNKFSLILNKTLSEKLITIVSASSQTSECFYLLADKPESELSLFTKRIPDHEYHINYGDGVFYILTNKDNAFNFKLMEVPYRVEEQSDLKPQNPETWKELIPHREDVFIEDYEIFKDFIILEIRNKGRQEIEILDKKTRTSHTVFFSEDICSAELGSNYEYDTSVVRIDYASYTSPEIIYDYKIQTKELVFKRQYPIKGKFKSEDYTSKREFVKARDGSLIPISLIYRKDLKISSSTPVLLYGYGSYGISMDVSFNPSLISLLDRGFVYAVSHIRGGSDLGKKWYEDGKFLKKKNTFYDFIDSAEFLIQNKYTSSEHLYIMGGSAGGLLMGAVLNERPDLFNGAIASVPFVDVLTTILDESLPLTTGEYEEWGNPNDKTYYHYIKSYSPYDNLQKSASYPHLLIDTGYHDPRVQYWEPAKWVAKLREYKKNENLLLFNINMGTGHFGDTGRFGRLKLTSLYYAFLLGLESDILSPKR